MGYLPMHNYSILKFTTGNEQEIGRSFRGAKAKLYNVAKGRPRSQNVKTLDIFRESSLQAGLLGK